MLAAASSGVGERHGGVKGVETKMVAKFGTLRQVGKRAHANRAFSGTQSAWTRMPAPLDERGHRVDYDIRPS